jgi:hypothetical protein
LSPTSVTGSSIDLLGIDHQAPQEEVVLAEDTSKDRTDLSKQSHDQAGAENNNPEPNGPGTNEQMIADPDDPAGPKGLVARSGSFHPEMMYCIIKPTK